MNFKKLRWWLLAAFLIWWAVQQPHAAANAVHHLGTFASHAAAGLSTFAASI